MIFLSIFHPTSFWQVVALVLIVSGGYVAIHRFARPSRRRLLSVAFGIVVVILSTVAMKAGA